MAQPKMVVWAFGVVSVLCFLAAVIPLFRGGTLNGVFLACGVVFLVVAAAVRAKSARTDSNVPPAA